MFLRQILDFDAGAVAVAVHGAEDDVRAPEAPLELARAALQRAVVVIEDAAAPFNKFAVQRLHALNAADDEHPLAAQIERGATLVAVPAATGPAGISRHARQAFVV